jgi:hypothetical protein
MLAPLPTPCVPPGFPLLVANGGLTVYPDGPTTPGTEAGGQIASPGYQTALGTEAGGQTAPHTEPGGQTATLDDPTARTCAAPSSLASPTSVAPRGTLDSTRTTCGPGVYNYGRTTHDSEALPAPLLVSPSSYVKATDTASMLAVAVGEGRTGVTSNQSSSGDQACEVGFSASD